MRAYRSARELFLAVGDQLGQGNTFKGEADVLFRLGDNEGSLRAYRSARELFVAVGDQLGQGNTFEGEADVLFRLGDNEGSLRAYRSARELFVAVGDQLGQGNTFLGEGRVLRADGKSSEAAAAAREAFNLYDKIKSEYSKLQAILLEIQCRDRFGETETVHQLAVDAIALHAAWRRGYVTDFHRLAGDERINTAYDALLTILGRQPEQAEEALRLAEEARSRSLLDLLAGDLSGHGRIPLNLENEYDQLIERAARNKERRDTVSDPKEREELSREQKRIDEDLQRNAYQRRSAAAASGAAPELAPLSASEIHQLADEAGPLLIYYAADIELLAFLVRPGVAQPRVQRIALSWGQLGSKVRALAQALANPIYEDGAKPQAEELWQLLIAPLAADLPADGTLTIIPHGPLHELPFEALIDPATGQHLFQRWHLSVAPSASVLAQTRARHQPAAKVDSFVAMASGTGLKLTDDEVKEIAALFGQDKATFESSRARFDLYQKFAPRTRHLLVATLGVHVADNPYATHLQIQATPGVHSSWLTASEITTIPLEAELVTLAACDTASGRALLSDDRLDLTRAFLIAGTAAVLATRWKVPEDYATTQFLLDFYRAYRGGPGKPGMRKDQALSQARQLSIERGDPAQLWAAWVLVGDAR